jgi:hypothetical protein
VPSEKIRFDLHYELILLLRVLICSL